MSAKKFPPRCDYCGLPAELVSGMDIYPHRPDLKSLSFWQCKPCKAHVGCHKKSNFVPLGRLADAELRKAKQKAHAAFDPLWKNKIMHRREAYAWLAKELKISIEKCHIGYFDIDMCTRVVKIIEARKTMEDLEK